MGISQSVPQGLKPSSTRPIVARLKPCPSFRVVTKWRDMRFLSTGIRFRRDTAPERSRLGRYTAGMYQIRAATPADAAVITHHRRRMFVDAGRQDNRVLDVMAEYFKPWVETRLADGRYIGWLTSENGTVVAGAGLIVLDWPPHPLDPRQDKRGYLLNVYVEPEHRRKKLASQLIDQALAEARKQKIRVVALHSTDEGRPLYESNGFRRTNEMFYVEPVEG
jgi:ribosomal protein S18 acetylase RimI-like enzyme